MRGFSLIELMVVVVILAVLLMLGVPAFSGWMANGTVRTVAESLQNDIRQAQAQAVRGNRQVALILTNNAPEGALVVAAASTRNWSIRALPRVNSDEGVVTSAGTTTYIVGNAQDAASAVTVNGEVSALCFNTVGRLVTSADAIVDAGGVSCAAPTTNTPRYFRVQNVNGDRPLWVQVNLGGQIRMCDPNKTLPDSPDACCTTLCCKMTEATHCIY